MTSTNEILEYFFTGLHNLQLSKYSVFLINIVNGIFLSLGFLTIFLIVYKHAIVCILI